MDDTLATMTPSARLAPVHPLSAAAACRQGTDVPGSKAHLVCYDGDVFSIENDRFSTNALRHKLGNDICLPVALSRKANPLAVCDCYGQPGHEELGHGAHKIRRSARAVADAAHLPSNKRLKPQPTDGERTSQRQWQARAGGAADAQRLGELGDLVWAVLESVSIENRPAPRRQRSTQTASAPPSDLSTDPSPSPTTPLPDSAGDVPSPSQQPVGKGKGRVGEGERSGQGRHIGSSL
eukprot:201901-Pleurochrysis_carterae.AAC.3